MAGITAIPLPYRLFFLYIEPVATLAGAYMAYFDPLGYLQMTDAASAPSALPVGVHAVLHQLANLYLLFALSEAFILRATNEMSVWRTLLVGMLIADMGHLWSVSGIQGGGGGLLDVMEWNAMGWGNIGFVYAGATMRSLFLLGVGLRGAVKKD